MRSRPFEVGAELTREGRAWERGPADGRIYEIEGRIVGRSQHELARVSAPVYMPEPVPLLEAAWTPGDQLALLGRGLVIEQDSTHSVQIHRLARTLAAHEAGARWVFARVPVPEASLEAIMRGDVRHDPISIPIEDGYWPIGIVGDDVVLVRRNYEF